MMDRYKKKPMKFMGKAQEVRAADAYAARRSVRQQRFSLQRALEDVNEPSTNKNAAGSQASKLPTLASRHDMLMKWKAEKALKRRLELNSKKPIFKVGSSKPQLGALGLSTLQESKSESYSSKVLTPNRSISKPLKASRIQPVSKLADITHHKNINSEANASGKTIQMRSNISSRPEANASGKTIQTRSIPSVKPQIARIQVKEAKIREAQPPTKSATPHQPSHNLTKSSFAPSNIKPPSNTGIKANKNLYAPNFKPQSNSGVKESKISNSTKPVAGKSAVTKGEIKIPISRKPKTFLPRTIPQLQNQQNKFKPVSIEPSKKIVKAVETPLNKDPEVKSETVSSWDQSLCCPLSAIEASGQDKSFAPPEFVFCPPKIRSSWLDDEGPYTILNEMMKERKLRTSTPIKKELIEHQEVKSSFNEGNCMNTGESSKVPKKESNTIPDLDTKHIESLIDSSSAKLSDLETDDKAKVSKSVAAVVSSSDNLKPVSDIDSPVTELASSDKEKPELEASPEKEAIICVASENNFFDESKDCGDVKELSDVSSPIVRPVLEQAQDRLRPSLEDSILKDEIDADISVFYTSEPAALAPQKSKRFFSNCWKMEKPSLALISESPEHSKEMPQMPKSHRRKGLLAEEFTPRRSPRLARKSMLKEENIFEEKECFLDSSSVEAATRMSTMTYDFDALHLEASASQVKSKGSQLTSANRGKVSLLYTPPRRRASTRNKSLKGDLMTFSPNVQ